MGVTAPCPSLAAPGACARWIVSGLDQHAPHSSAFSIASWRGFQKRGKGVGRGVGALRLGWARMGREGQRISIPGSRLLGSLNGGRLVMALVLHEVFAFSDAADLDGCHRQVEQSHIFLSI